MPSAGQTNIANARTTFETLTQNALLQDREQGAWELLAQKKSGISGTAVQFTVPGATPNWQQWRGTKSAQGARKLARSLYFDKWHKTLELDRSDVVHDPDGSTAAQIAYFVRDVGYVYSKIVYEKLGENPIGADGVSILNNSHPFGGYNNKTSDALSFAAYKAARATMREAADEYAEPLDIMPDTLIVHPDEEQVALEIAQATARPISVGTAGAINTGGIGATGIDNVFKGAITVIVTPRFPSGDWLLIDSRYPPIALAEWRAPETVILDQMTDAQRFYNDQFVYSVEADIAAEGLWHIGVYGKLT